MRGPGVLLLQVPFDVEQWPILAGQVLEDRDAHLVGLGDEVVAGGWSDDRLVANLFYEPPPGAKGPSTSAMPLISITRRAIFISGPGLLPRSCTSCASSSLGETSPSTNA